MTAFLARAGWGAAERRHLAGDASDRRYERLHAANGTTAVLMDNPPGGADDPVAFALIARHLRGLGLSAPEILAADLDQGFLLLEDLGDDLYARLLDANPAGEPELYAAAVEVLLQLQAHPLPPGLPNLSAEDWAEAAILALDCYAFAATGQRPPSEDFRASLARAMRRHADGPRVLILRDYHAQNLLWLPRRTGTARVGLLDFQLGQSGQPGYDLMSLVQDARRDVDPATETAMIARFCKALGAEPVEFSAHCATLGAQRALRIMGVFARLAQVAGKPQYLPLIPRVWGHLQRNLAHPALAELAGVCARALPEPTSERLQRIAQSCLTSPSP